jgi:hypothetical protein
MSMDTDASELSPRRMRERAELRRDYDDKYGRGNGNIYNGQTKIITWMMALLNVLVAAGIVGGIMMYGRVGALETGFQDMKEQMKLIIDGHIRIVPHAD